MKPNEFYEYLEKVVGEEIIKDEGSFLFGHILEDFSSCVGSSIAGYLIGHGEWNKEWGKAHEDNPEAFEKEFFDFVMESVERCLPLIDKGFNEYTEWCKRREELDKMFNKGAN